MKSMTATKLRQNIYRVIDQVARTGEPVVVESKGVVLQLAPYKKGAFSRLDAFRIKRNIIRGDPEDLVHIDWSKYWKPFL